MIYKIKLFIKIIVKNRNNRQLWHLAFLVFKPRYEQVNPKLFGKKIHVPDAASYIFMCREIFERKIYEFQTTKKEPFIIDGGANIGLSVIFFKKLYPNAKIIAFEPDNQIFNILKSNIKKFGFQHIKLEKKALWKTETTLKFQSEGADGGRLESKSNSDLIEVSTLSLRSYLQEEVDFLKLDIEGAETTVLESCEDLLGNVKNLFVEYHSFYPESQTLEKILTILTKNGFRYYLENNGVSSKNPFQKIHTESGMDLQLNIFAYRN